MPSFFNQCRRFLDLGRSTLERLMEFTPIGKITHDRRRFNYWLRFELLEDRTMPSVVVAGDFNGDGLEDLAMGNPYEDVSSVSDAGAVTVIYGSAPGLTNQKTQQITQNTAGILDQAESGDQFGFALAVGDFNGDGYDDLAVGMPYENIDSASDCGLVQVIYGSSIGLTSAGNSIWHQDSTEIHHRNGSGDNFGYALTTGDFDGDGYDDLAIGLPGNYAGPGNYARGGGVEVLFGSQIGIDYHRDQFYEQDAYKILNKCETNDEMGRALAAGDVNHDGYDDLIIGVPGEDSSSGAIHVIFGSANQLTWVNNQFWTQNSTDVQDASESGDFFGSSLSVGDFNGDGFDDIAVGVRNEDFSGASDAGAVNVLFGSAAGPTALGNLFLTQANITALQSGAQFGRALSAGDFNGDGKDDLAVGIPFYDFGNNPRDAGAVGVLYSSASGLGQAGSQFFYQGVQGIPGSPESNDQFGGSLASGRFNGDGFADLAIGVPNETYGSNSNLGEADVLYGSGTGLANTGVQAWTPTIVAPTSLVASAVSTSQINLVWSDQAGNENGYQLERSADGVNFTLIAMLGQNSTSYNNSGLTPSTGYYYRIRATSSIGNSAYSEIATAFTGSPTAPTNLTAQAISKVRIDINWADNSLNESGFRIERSTDAVNYSLVTTVAANVTAYSNFGLAENVRYYYRVQAANSTFGNSPYSNVVSAITAGPAKPTRLTATLGINQINLLWTDSADNETGYQVERATNGGAYALIAGLGANATSFSDAAVNAGNAYAYRIRAINLVVPSGYSNVATVSMIPPQAPTTLTATVFNIHQIKLAWTDNATNETGFEIVRSSDGINFALIATVGVNVKSYSNTSLTPNTTYYYQVQAINQFGASGYSNTASETTSSPLTPDALNAQAVSAVQINLTWADQSGNETGFLIERSINGVTFATLTTVAAGVTSHSDITVSADTTYWYRIRAVNGAGASAPSNVSSAVTSAPAPPASLTAAAVSGGQINLGWTDAATIETGFEIERSTDGVNFAALVTLGSNLTSYSDTTVAADTTYHYRVRAVNLVGSSQFSNVASAVTAAPAAPTSLTAAAVSAGQINLGWTDASTIETGFELERSSDGVNFTALMTVGSNVTSFSDMTVSADATYHYRVRAVNLVGSSEFSNVASDVTSAPAAPSALSAAAVSASQINLGWTDNSGNEAGFEIERSSDGVNFTALATVGSNVTSYSDTTVSADTTYHYRVRAANAVGASAFSDIATDVTSAPAAPSALLASATVPNQIDLAWTDHAGNEASFVIERSLDGINFSSVAVLAANTVAYSDSGLDPNTQYFYRMKAVNLVGDSLFSDPAEATTL